MCEEEEDVVFANSPLEKYLKEVGYTDYEPESANTLLHSSDNFSNGNGSVSANLSGVSSKVDYFLDQLKGFFVSKHYVDCRREDCVSRIINSGILNEDDLEFLQRFDPELFEQDACHDKVDLSCGNVTFVASNYFWAVFICALGVVFGTTNLLGSFCLSVVLAWLIVAPACFYMWRSYQETSLHRRNVQLLDSYTKKVKALTLLMRKATSFIQEMQFVFKGYTMVKAGVPMLFNEKHAKGDSTDSIYPALRETVYKCAHQVTTVSCAAANHLVSKYPLSAELNSMFTYIGTVSLSEFGITEGLLESDTKPLPLQALKTITSVLAGQQSEFLSRFLLCLSLKAQDTDSALNCFDKIYSSFDEIFAVSLEAVEIALQSLERSYHLHRSAASDGKSKQSTQIHVHQQKASSKFGPISRAMHSLELHLKAGLLRINSIQVLIDKLNEVREDQGQDSSQVKQNLDDLETLFGWVKINLNSAISCWEEGLHKLEFLSDKEQSTVNREESNKESETLEGMDVKEPQSFDICEMVDAHKEEVDQIFEAYSDPSVEGKVEQVTLSAEDLAKEKRQIEESRRVLLELKNVLYSHSKDPLISESGFVQPPQKPQSSTQDNLNNTDEAVSDLNETELPIRSEVEGFDWDTESKRMSGAPTLTKKCNSEILEDEKSPEMTSSFEELNKPLELKANVSEQACHSSYRRVMRESPLNTNFQSSVAFSVAAAALARSQNMGMEEECFGSDDSD